MIKYINGDLFNHLHEDIAIAHVCNNQGAWGAGFVLPLAKRFPVAKTSYLTYCCRYNKDILGTVNFVQTEDIVIFNMIAQTLGGRRPLRYNKLADCMEKVASECSNYGISTIFCPKFGSGLAGGNWDFIEDLIIDCWYDFEVKVFYL